MVNTTTWIPAMTKLPSGSRLKAYAGSLLIEGFTWWAGLPCLETEDWPFVTECEDCRWRLEMGAFARIIGSRGESLTVLLP